MMEIYYTTLDSKYPAHYHDNPFVINYANFTLEINSPIFISTFINDFVDSENVFSYAELLVCEITSLSVYVLRQTDG